MVAEVTKTEEAAAQGMPMPEHALGIYEQGEVAKFMATASNSGEPNVALIVSQIPVEAGKVVFGEFMMVKTKSNLSENPRIASLVITEKLEMAGFKADVGDWIDSGPYVDRINNIDFFRYNAYAGIHQVAVATIREMVPLPEKVSYLTVGREFLTMRGRGMFDTRGAADGVETPAVVRKKFNSIVSIKVLAFLDDDGYPGLLPAFSTRFSSPGELRFKISAYNWRARQLEVPCRVALNVLTVDLMTYQVKGELTCVKKTLGVETGVVRVDEVYSSMPPFCGRRVR